MTTIYNLSIAANVTLDMHSLNNEGGEGNQIQTRIVTVVDDQGRLHSVNAISGDMLKHIQAEHLYYLAKDDADLPLCKACSIFDANRMSADPDFQKFLKGKPTPVQVVDKLLACTLDDLEGNLITQGNQSVPRKSVVEFGWAIGIPESVSTEQYFHVKYDPDRREIPTEKTERSGNLGQAIFHRPANSGQYALIVSVEASRIGFNDINQSYAEGVDREKRLKALLESLLYTFVQPSGAMRNTQNPHIVAAKGAISYSTAPAPAPLISPLNRGFVDEMQQVAQALNGLHQDRIHVLPFNSLAEFAQLMQSLIADAQPYTFTL